MSPVAIKDLVFFHPNGSVSNSAFPAIVTHVGRESVNLVVFGFGSHGTTIRECVRHWDDPKLVDNGEIRKDGCWSMVLNPKTHAQGETARPGSKKPKPELQPA